MREEFSFIFRLLKSLISQYLESIAMGWSESLKGVSIGLHSVKNDFKSSSDKIVSLENRKLWKTEFKRQRLEFDCLEDENVFYWQLKHIYETLCFIMLWYCKLFRLVQIL